MATLFPLGRVVATPGALEVLANMDGAVNANMLLKRHSSGDWGDLAQEDKQANDAAVKGGDRILSAYKFGKVKLWVITECDRSATTILLPEDY